MYSRSGLCPPFGLPTSNIFGATLGIEFTDGPDSMIRPLSAYEVTSCFCLSPDLTYSLSHPENNCLLDCGIPSRNAHMLLLSIILCLDAISAEGFEMIKPNRLTVPTALANIPIFTNSAIGPRVPGNDV